MVASLIGSRFGRLTVVSEARRDNSHRYLNCKCDCGSERVVTANNLRRGHSKSCGCMAREMSGGRVRTHGKTGSAEYRIWHNMKVRCLSPKSVAFKDYGGRGIRIHQPWVDSFAQFLADVGSRPDPSLTLDRINNDGNYEPGNVQWATRSQQARNRRKASTCRNGHPFDYVKPSGQRCCRRCKSEALRRWRAQEIAERMTVSHEQIAHHSPDR